LSHPRISLSCVSVLFFFTDPATTDTYTLSLHDALPICLVDLGAWVIILLDSAVPEQVYGNLEQTELDFLEQALADHADRHVMVIDRKSTRLNSSHVKISYAVFCLKKKITIKYRKIRQTV